MTNDEEDWDDALGEAKENGISADMARALLQMNPKLRAEGKDTAWILKSGRKSLTPPAKPKGEDRDALSEIEARQKELEDGDKRAAQEIARLQADRAKAKADTLDAVMRYFLETDPKLVSPITQQALQDGKAFLERIGFSVKAFVELKRKLGVK